VDTGPTGPRPRIRRGGTALGNTIRHWHVTLTLAGEPVEPLIVRAAMQRLTAERQFLDSVTSTGASVEIQFWDEGECMLDVASLAMRMWNEHRESAKLPCWEVVGLEIVEKDLRERRTSLGRRA
jgi:hypothetical protein